MDSTYCLTDKNSNMIIKLNNSVKADMRSKDFVSAFLLQQLLDKMSRSGKGEK